MRLRWRSGYGLAFALLGLFAVLVALAIVVYPKDAPIYQPPIVTIVLQINGGESLTSKPWVFNVDFSHPTSRSTRIDLDMAFVGATKDLPARTVGILINA